ITLSGMGHGIDNFGLNRSSHFSSGAEPLPTRLSDVNDAGPLRIAQVGVWVAFFDRIESNKTRGIRSFDSNLLADGAADGLQHSRVSRAVFRLVLQLVLLRQAEF